ncbi:MAG TPA: hypothetical protein VF723_17665 [Pyrinomonadaceae bacterium]|jgi:hypothetical protein
MRERNEKSRPVHENLDTSYVNLSALLRYLQQREFVCRVHVELDEYDADVFLQPGERPRIRETDHLTGRQGTGEEALQRLLVRAREPGGLVSVYEGTDTSTEAGDVQTDVEAAAEDAQAGAADAASPEESDWLALVRVSGELVAAVERAALSTGANFDAIFRAVRLSLADDYSFLDPATARFEYANGAVRLHARPGAKAYVASISETLRRVVDQLAKGQRGGGARERVALELAVLARRRQSQLARFQLAPQLDRIAGTRVL